MGYFSDLAIQLEEAGIDRDQTITCVHCKKEIGISAYETGEIGFGCFRCGARFVTDLDLKIIREKRREEDDGCL